MILALHSTGLSQANGQEGERIGGRITAITGNSIDVARRDESTATIVTTGNTKFFRNGEPATLEDFAVGDFVVARGQQNGNGAFVAEGIRGGDRMPHPHGADRLGGKVTSVDVAQGTVEVTNRDGETEVIYTTAETRILKDRQPATLSDLAAGDRLRAHGERDPDERFVADRILGASPNDQ